ncbi:MAG: tetratricopeptide repeat protein [Acidiferrobacterales bacterium]
MAGATSTLVSSPGAAGEPSAGQNTDTQITQHTPANFVGRQVCAGCHQRESQLWSGSHHDLAMQRANDKTVLGDFDNVTFTYDGITSTFYKHNGKFFVRTDGPDGMLRDYEISYTFGAYPLQQYLVAFPGGRYQALGIAWDSRPRAEGGQHWFHLYSDEKISYDDPLHWSGRNQTWNFMCAECHSTNLEKNYSLEKDSYATQWSEIDVSCEACHGPGSTHVGWAQAAAKDKSSYNDERKGLVVALVDRADVHWKFDRDTAIARRNKTPITHTEVETCGRCHSRRTVLSNRYGYGKPLLQSYLPRLLDEGFYYPDGQIQDEVYVYGSFLQSKMYHAGVTCSDCHEPHSLQLTATGNAVCAQCHLPERFDSRAHTHHKKDAAGPQCVACHMPTKTYMVVDPRRDHSIRVPRPDLSVALGTPNACNQCHTDKPAQWAADNVAKWYGPKRRRMPHYGRVLQAGRMRAPGADQELARLADDPARPAIVRASALTLLHGYVNPVALQALQNGLADKNPLIRIAALNALAGIPPLYRFRVAGSLLVDPIRAVRVEAARVLAPAPVGGLTPKQRTGRVRAFAEFIEAQRANADRPGAHLNIGVFYAQQEKLADAEAAYRTALRLDPDFVPALVNLADLYRAQQRDGDGEPLLRQALAIAPDDASVHRALGLLLVRQRKTNESVELFRRAAELAPDDPQYAYVYAIALNAVGKTESALAVLEDARQHHPNDRQILLALVTINRDRGAREAALRYARELVALSPRDSQARQLLDQLQRQ